MANFKRHKMQKTRYNPYKSWESDCENHSDAVRRMAAEHEANPPRNLHRRKKGKKRVKIKAKSMERPSTFSLRSYEKMRDAEKGLVHAERSRWPGWFYCLWIEED